MPSGAANPGASRRSVRSTTCPDFYVFSKVGDSVASYGAVWVGFPVLRQCFNDYLGWTQTTNNPAESDLYRLALKDGGYVLDWDKCAGSMSCAT